MNDQQIAEEFIAKNQDVWFCHPEYGKGKFEILEDCNCCAPTNTVLFAFVMETSRKVFDASGLLKFVQETKKEAQQ